MPGATERVGAYPGSFNPPTVAHLAVARAALEQAGLDRVDLVVSESALGKEDVLVPSLDDRVATLRRVASTRPWLGVRVTPLRLIADIAEHDDAVIVGADKWAQLLDPAWYGGSVARRDAALARLPRVLVAPREPYPPPDLDGDIGLATPALLLRLDAGLAAVSSTGARAGRREWILSEAEGWDAAGDTGTARTDRSDRTDRPARPEA